MSVIDTRRALRDLRLQRAWSWEELAADVARVTGTRISASTLLRFVANKHKSYATTRSVLERYIAAVSPAQEVA